MCASHWNSVSSVELTLLFLPKTHRLHYRTKIKTDQMKKNVSSVSYFIGLSGSWNPPPYTHTHRLWGGGGKHFILLGVTWFSMISFHFQDVLRKWPPFELSTQMMQGLKGALWNRLFSQWFLNQEIEKHITRKEPGRGRNELCGVLTVPMNMKTMGAKSQRS